MNASVQNPTESKNYRSFEDLEVYQTARDFRKLMYGVAKILPDPARIEKLKTAGWHLLKLTNGYLRNLRDRKLGSTLAIHEAQTIYSAGESDESMEWLEKLLEENPELKPESAASPLI